MNFSFIKVHHSTLAFFAHQSADEAPIEQSALSPRNSCKIRWIWGGWMSKLLSIISYVTHRSTCIISLTSSTLSSVTASDGLPFHSSTSKNVLPRRNSANRFLTVVYEIYLDFYSLIVLERSSLTENRFIWLWERWKFLRLKSLVVPLL